MHCPLDLTAGHGSLARFDLLTRPKNISTITSNEAGLNGSCERKRSSQYSFLPFSLSLISVAPPTPDRAVVSMGTFLKLIGTIRPIHHVPVLGWCKTSSNLRYKKSCPWIKTTLVQSRHAFIHSLSPALRLAIA